MPSELGDEVAGDSTSKRTRRFAVGEPHPADLVGRLIELRRRESSAAEAWDDIASLQESVTRAQQLRAEIAERCG